MLCEQGLGFMERRINFDWGGWVIVGSMELHGRSLKDCPSPRCGFHVVTGQHGVLGQ